MLKKDQLLMLKEKYEDLYETFSLMQNDDEYKHIISWLENDIYRIKQEIQRDTKNIYSLQNVQLYLPEELEKKARTNAEKIGLIKGDEGILSSYISLLINNDLKNKQIVNKKIAKINDIKYSESEQNRVSVYLTKEQQELARDRAIELGYVWGGRGNLSRYIKLLIALDD